ncbi:MAG: DUF4292 domain-containing protein [Flavobacteriales bacterium]|nr:DUF4292 domain-containing protein [Flavobacteriales bacterium]
MNKNILILFVLVVSFSSCDLLKKNTDIDSYIDSPSNSKELIKKVNLNNISPEWMSLNTKIKINKEGQETTINSQIRVRKDSVIWVSVKAPLGIEVFRTMITPDSIYFMSRMDKTYFVKPISHLKNVVKADISFNQLQSILFASPEIKNENFEFSDSPNISYNFSLKSSKISYSIHPLFYRVEKIEIIESEEKRLEINFYNYLTRKLKEDEGIEDFIGFFPNKILVNVLSDEVFDAEINYTKIEFNKKSSLSFKIPSSYVQID